MYKFVDMNSYFASCEQQANPDLRGRPVGVVPMDADTTCCIAASYEAKKCGVKTGTSVKEAKILCPNIEIVVAQTRLYRRMHDQIIAAVERVTPIQQVLSVDELVIAPWRNDNRLSDALRTGQNIQDSIRTHVGEWMTCSVGVAPNQLLAKVAGDFQKPRGLSVISRDDIPHKLHHMDLTDWPGIAKGMQKRFEREAVRTTEEMYHLSIKEMSLIFGGITGERWWRMIWGQSVQFPIIKRSNIGHSNVLAPEYRSREGSWSIATRLLEKASARMRSEGFHARRLTVTVESFQNERWSRTIRFTCCNRTSRFLEILSSLWGRATPDGDYHTIKQPSHVTVVLGDIIEDRDVVLDLFTDYKQIDLDVAVDRINRKYGNGKLTVASSLATKGYLDHARIPFGKPVDFK